MNWRDFLSLAARLAGGATEADWRTAVSRAYYAAFHVDSNVSAGHRSARNRELQVECRTRRCAGPRRN